MLDMVLIILNVWGLVLWLNMWYVLEIVPCALERNVYFAVCRRNVLKITSLMSHLRPHCFLDFLSGRPIHWCQWHVIFLYWYYITIDHLAGCSRNVSCIGCVCSSVVVGPPLLLACQWVGLTLRLTTESWLWPYPMSQNYPLVVSFLELAGYSLVQSEVSHQVSSLQVARASWEKFLCR